MIYCNSICMDSEEFYAKPKGKPKKYKQPEGIPTKGKDKTKKDYSKERDRKRNYD